MTQKPPAILIGGPPNSGKSVLSYALTRALHQHDLAHYLYRATPDGEGNYSQESQADDVKALRIKGEFTPKFVQRINDDVKNRIFPLLVDVGGRPRLEQTAFHGECTHAILIIADRADDPTAYEREKQYWHTLMRHHQVPIIADIISVQNQPGRLHTTTPHIHGSLANLERRQSVIGPTLNALIEKLRTIFTTTHNEMVRKQFKTAPTELKVDLEKLADTLNEAPNHPFKPAHLPQICHYVPSETPLSLYGRSPNYVYATLACHSLPATAHVFDIRLGWVEPPPLPMIPLADLNQHQKQYGWHATVHPHQDANVLTLYTHSQLLTITDNHHLPLPTIKNTHSGLIISGKLPNWLLASAVRQLAPKHPWLAVYQPQIEGAAVIYSRDPKRPLGHHIPYTPTPYVRKP